MPKYRLDLTNVTKDIYSGHLQLGGKNPQGDEITFTNYFMEQNGKPFFGIVGEFHYSRYPYQYWEESIRKIKAGGINLIASYVLWNYHEEEEGIFDWDRDNNLRYFVDLCAKNQIQVILRIGPFAHGEVRNGGIPDWLYGRPFDIRSNDPEYLQYAQRWYSEIGKQVQGLMFQDGGPIVGIQLENEYMHAGAPWEVAYKSGVYMTPGRDGEDHLIELKRIALEASLNPAYFTGTAWGGAPIIKNEMLPMLAGYAFTPWNPGENFIQDPTKEYLFEDLHTNQQDKTEYNPIDYPLAFCEMGGGIQITYNHRPVVPPESVEAMTVVKIGNGSNLIGYYMYHGGSNRIGKHSYLNEFTVPKISYDFQAPIREYGQIAESYQYLRSLFLMLDEFGDQLARTKTVVPENAKDIKPDNVEELRYCVRSNKDAGFIFINNYQDHVENQNISEIQFELALENRTLLIPAQKEITVKKDQCMILPFNLDLEGLKLIYSTSQPLTKIITDSCTHYFFYTHDEMEAEYCFYEDEVKELQLTGASMKKSEGNLYIASNCGLDNAIVIHTLDGKTIKITTLTRSQALQSSKLHLWGQDRLVISPADLMSNQGNLEIISRNHQIEFNIYPEIQKEFHVSNGSIKNETGSIFDQYIVTLEQKTISFHTKKSGEHRMVLEFDQDLLKGIHDAFLKIDYRGDTGNAFIDGRLISDNFYNGGHWEIGLKRFVPELLSKGMYVYISPIRRGKMITHMDQAYVERFEGEEIAEIRNVQILPEYRVLVSLS